ncbi:uncharacterized protein A4U43_C07F11100 [Asparagus officinalis]|uniref:Uncharacterized protein n=1 Tax=Asparagus officinalis TaxID=4686 RepID=A0A5P1EG75_ASPOF|nr:uncharacterized protein A4U43_C07F11100 [Asparagus officinalis]
MGEDGTDLAQSWSEGSRRGSPLSRRPRNGRGRGEAEISSLVLRSGRGLGEKLRDLIREREREREREKGGGSEGTRGGFDLGRGRTDLAAATKWARTGPISLRAGQRGRGGDLLSRGGHEMGEDGGERRSPLSCSDLGEVWGRSLEI